MPEPKPSRLDPRINANKAPTTEWSIADDANGFEISHCESGRVRFLNKMRPFEMKTKIRHARSANAEASFVGQRPITVA